MVAYSKKLHLKELYYYSFLILIIFCKGIGLSSSSNIYRMIFFVSLIFLFLKIINDRWKRNEIYYVLLFLIIIFINYIIVQKETLILAFLILIGIKDIELLKIFKVMFYVRIISFLGVIFLTSLGILENDLILFWRDGIFIERYGYGFSNPNLLHASFTILLLLYMYINKKMSFFTQIGLLGLNQIIYIYSYSRSGYIIAILAIIMYYFSRYNAVRRTIYFVTPYIQIILLVLSVLLGSIFYSKTLDNILTGRLYYIRNQLAQGVSFLGSNFEGKNIIFDNSYSMLLVLYGIVITLLFMVGYFLAARKLKKLKI